MINRISYILFRFDITGVQHHFPVYSLGHNALPTHLTVQVEPLKMFVSKVTDDDDDDDEEVRFTLHDGEVPMGG